jgi:hypothetical protein
MGQTEAGMAAGMSRASPAVMHAYILAFLPDMFDSSRIFRI